MTDTAKGSDSFRGVWVMHKPEQPPDFVLYYVHGTLTFPNRSV